MNDFNAAGASTGTVEQKMPEELTRLVPIFEDMMLMLHESLKKIPHATSNLVNVTKRNEKVVSEVLSIVDKLGPTVNALTKDLTSISQSVQRRKEIRNEIAQTFSQITKNKRGPLVEKLRDLWHDYETIPSVDTEIQTMLENLKIIQSESTNIVMALQVQDITAQHIVAVNHLIESVQNRLTIMLQKFYGAEFRAVIPDSSRERLANYMARQPKKAHSQDILADTATETQDAIDRMFNEL